MLVLTMKSMLQQGSEVSAHAGVLGQLCPKAWETNLEHIIDEFVCKVILDEGECSVDISRYLYPKEAFGSGTVTEYCQVI